MEDQIQMLDTGAPQQTPPPTQPTTVTTRASRVFRIVIEIVAVLFWIYLVTKVFIFDVDVFLVQKLAPDYLWLLNFRFFFFIAAIAAVWLFTKSRRMLLWMLYVLLYPLILLLIYLPYFLLKQRSWILAFAVLDAILSFFRSIKFTFLTTSFLLCSTAIVLASSNQLLLWLAVSVLVITLLAIYVHRFISVFSPSSLFEVHGRILRSKFWSEAWQNVLSAYDLDESMSNLPVESLDEKQLEKWTANLQALVMFNRLSLFGARKLRDYQNSGLNIVSSVVTILALITLTVFCFSVADFGLYKINRDLFSFPSTPSFFTFVYYSFNNLLFNSVQDLIPKMPVSQLASMLESFFALILIAIFVSLVLSIRSQRFSDELDTVIDTLQNRGKDLESHIRDEYNFATIDDALAQLAKVKGAVVDILYSMSKSLE